MSMVEANVPGLKALKALSKKFQAPKSVDEVATEAAKIKDTQIEVARKTTKLQNIADELQGRLNSEITSIGEVGSPLLEAKILVEGLLEYRKQLEVLGQNPQFSENVDNKARLSQVFELIDSLISVGRQKVNDSINITIQKRSTLIAIETLRGEIEKSAAQFIAASKGAQATHVETHIAKQLGDGIAAMNEGHEKLLQESAKNIKDLTKTLKKTEQYRLENHGSSLTDEQSLQALVGQVEQMTLSTLTFNQTTAGLIAHQVETQDLILALAAPGNEQAELKQLEALINDPVSKAIESGNLDAIVNASLGEKPKN